MRVLYFPFTSISKSTMESLAACFTSVAVYRISETEMPDDMAEWADDGFLKILLPISGEEKKIHAILNDYKEWADLHQKTPSAYFKHQTEVPFYSDTSVSKIRTDITKRTKDKEKKGKTEINPDDRIFAARIFLTLAEEYDANRSFLHKELQVLHDMEKKLFDELKGEPDELAVFSLQGVADEKEDPGLYLSEERIKAWSCLMVADKKENGVYVTDSRGVFDFFSEQETYEKEGFTIGPIPIRRDKDQAVDAFKEKLTAFLEDLAVNSKPMSSPEMPILLPIFKGEATLTLTAQRIPGIRPREFFGAIVPDSDNLLNKNDNHPFKSTLICLLTPNDG